MHIFYTKAKAKANKEHSKKIDLSVLFYCQMMRKGIKATHVIERLLVQFFSFFNIFCIYIFLKFSNKNVPINTR